MTKETLVSKVQFIVDPAALKEMQLFGLKKNSIEPLKINVDQDFTQPIIDVVADGIKTYIIDANYTIVDYSTADERKNRYYRYDINDIPASMKVISDVIGNAHVNDYDLTDDGINELDSLIIVLSDGDGRRFSIFKHLSSVEKIAKSEKAVLGIVGDRTLKGVDQSLLRIGPSFQMIYTSGEYILTNENFAESNFKLHDVLKRQAAKLAKKLEDKKIVADMKKIKEYSKDAAFCRKLVKVLKDSKILESDFDKSKIFNFLDREPEVASKVNIIEKDDDKFIEVKNKPAAKTLLEILNDEYVKSEISDLKYLAPDKDNR